MEPANKSLTSIDLLEPQKQFLENINTYSLFSGGFGCVAGETKVFNPLTGKSKRIDSISSSNVYSIFSDSGDLSYTEALATKPKQYGKKNLYEVITKRGLKIIVTRQHRFLTPLGWK